MAAVLLAAGGGGGVTDLRTTVAMTSVEAKGAFAAASDLAPGFKSAGGALTGALQGINKGIAALSPA